MNLYLNQKIKVLTQLLHKISAELSITVQVSDTTMLIKEQMTII